MRKLLGLLAVAAFVLAVTSVKAEAFTGAASSTKTASITFSMAGSFEWELTVANINTNTSTSAITWSGVTPGTTEWKNADQYVIFNTTITDSSAKIRFYSDNKNGTNFKYTGTANKDLGGLVNKGASTEAPLPMGWMMTSSQTWNLGADNAVAPESSELTGSWTTSYGVFLLDASNDTFNAGDNVEYSQPITGGGIRWGGDPADDRGGAASGTFYMFISAYFKAAQTSDVTPVEYGCDTLVFQGYKE